MNSKLCLPGAPANEGAHRLAWLLTDHKADARKQLNERGVNDLALDRIVRGEILPGMDIGRAIFFVSNHAIAAWHWNTPAAGSWFDRPTDWPEFGSPAAFERRAA
ncbi:hypothetical protein [Sphingomonas sp. BAUL-RG-20F-R05-02]|uniref:hypothetical protein n=1 Tax=Sphingomonas sp. BAUL-RG-20F-R05-02 TaxID=2914830 RepID=UPI001F589ABF|nr:hypothetical protein [Sphingomonas sp. BAUL-RG-20F-R05-02]